VGSGAASAVPPSPLYPCIHAVCRWAYVEAASARSADAVAAVANQVCAFAEPAFGYELGALAAGEAGADTWV
jgi:hypothetical protein